MKLDASQLMLIDELCCQFEAAWTKGRRLTIASMLGQVDAAMREALFTELLAVELDFRKAHGEAPKRSEYEKEYAEFRHLLADGFASIEEGKPMKCPFCQSENPSGTSVCVKCSKPITSASDEVPMTTIGARCPKCGFEMPIGAKFCGRCGHRLIDSQAAPPAPPTPPAPSPPAPTPTAAVPETPPPTAPAEPATEPPVITPAVDSTGAPRDAWAEEKSPHGSLRPMVLIPAAEFLMGSDDEDASEDERPQHKVKLSAYFIDRHAVSNIEYERFDPKHKRSESSDGDHDPVVMVSYQDCLNYCRWRALQENAPPDAYGLPTEAQWEHAARGGQPDRAYPWGDTIDRELCNTKETGRGRTIGVAEGIPNRFLLFHMGSNVREWCLDWYSRVYYAQKVSQWIDPQGPAPGLDHLRVVRGASFIEPARIRARCTARGRAAPKGRQSDVGFRCVRLVRVR